MPALVGGKINKIINKSLAGQNNSSTYFLFLFFFFFPLLPWQWKLQHRVSRLPRGLGEDFRFYNRKIPDRNPGALLVFHQTLVLRPIDFTSLAYFFFFVLTQKV